MTYLNVYFLLVVRSRCLSFGYNNKVRMFLYHVFECDDHVQKRQPQEQSTCVYMTNGWRFIRFYFNYYIIIINHNRPAMLESHRPCGHKKNTNEKIVYSRDFFQRRNHNTISQQLNIGLNSFLLNKQTSSGIANIIMEII